MFIVRLIIEYAREQRRGSIQELRVNSIEQEYLQDAHNQRELLENLPLNRGSQQGQWIEIIRGNSGSDQGEQEQNWEQMNITNQVFLNKIQQLLGDPNQLQLKSLNYLQGQHDLVIEGGNKVGKTTIALIHILNQIDNSRYLNEEQLSITQAIIMTESIERALQIRQMIAQLDPQTSTYVVTGDEHKDKVIATQGCHVAVGTPTKIYQSIQKQILMCHKASILMIDHLDNIFVTQHNFIHDDRFYKVLKQLKKHVRAQVVCTLGQSQITQNPNRYIDCLDNLHLSMEQYFHLHISEAVDETDNTQQHKIVHKFWKKFKDALIPRINYQPQDNQQQSNQ